MNATVAITECCPEMTCTAKKQKNTLNYQLGYGSIGFLAAIDRLKSTAGNKICGRWPR